MTRTVPPHRLLTLQEAMDQLGVSRSTIDRWRRQRRLPFIKIGKEVLFDPLELERWVRKHGIIAEPPFTAAGTKPEQDDVVTIGYQSGTAHMWSPIIIRELRLFEQELAEFRLGRAIQVRWEDASSGLDLVEGMIAGRVQLASLGDYPIVMSRHLSRILPGFDVALLAFDGKSPGGRGISIAMPHGGRIKHLEDLLSATIATVPHSSAEFRLQLLLRQSGQSGWTVEHCSMKESWNSLLEKRVQASVMWEPYISLTQYAGAGHVLYESGIGGDYLTGLIGHRQWASRNEPIVLAYLKAHLRAHRFMREEPFTAAKIVARATGFPFPVAVSVLNRVRWDAAVYTKDLMSLRELPAFPSIGPANPLSAPDPLIAETDYLAEAARLLALPRFGSELRDSEWSAQFCY
ncbi:helix-turn-helix domain-containing protein [Paenibacillus aurantiacus]|uniref:Helix-turn-helix domain-containing protein n=1 Tax=Paenibacillus aurantiacus TaxID=1936118 RepID=A0ABV5KHA7_9BACL